MKNHIKISLFFTAFALIAMSLACNLPGYSSQSVVDSEQIPISSEAAEDLIQSIETAVGQAVSDKQFTLVITEAQVTSLVNIELENINEAPISNVQVFLRNEQIQVRGDVEQSGIKLEFTSVLTASIDENGQIKFNVISAKAGPFTIPQDLIDKMIGNLETNFAKQFLPNADVVVLDNISIQNGEMTITGHTR